MGKVCFYQETCQPEGCKGKVSSVTVTVEGMIPENFHMHLCKSVIARCEKRGWKVKHDKKEYV